jgi:glutamine amidotransferase-like uncharacterized protein
MNFRSVIYIYYGPGTSTHSVMHTAYTLKNIVPSKYKIKTLQPQQLILGNWISDAALFILPGGRDLPYVKDLRLQGDIIIKSFIDQGGSFLGICAGAYYSSSEVQFALGTDLEIYEKRTLGLFPGVVKGPCLNTYNYQNNSGACAADINVSVIEKCPIKLFYNGGGFFLNADSFFDIEVLATYASLENKPAIIKRKYGKGVVVLTGVHPEYAPELIDSKDKYLNEIIDDLKSYETQRLALMRYLMAELNIL